MSSPTLVSYAVRGTYADGIVRHHHVSLSTDVLAYASRLLTGFLPFAKVEVRRCDAFLDCSHYAGGVDWAFERDLVWSCCGVAKADHCQC